MTNIVHFHNGTGGGVLSVIRNLLEFSCNLNVRNHVIFTINKNQNSFYTPPFLKGAISIQLFYYSPDWNFYYTCKQLKKLLPEDDAVLVAHDWLELGMISNLGLKNPVVQFLHGDYDYYYELAKKNSPGVNQFITVARNIEIQLKQLLPSRGNNISYLRFPVPPAFGCENEKKENNIIFIGRLCEGKGYHLLPVIARIIEQKVPGLNWHIVGDSEQDSLRLEWDKNIIVKFYGNIPNELVRQLLNNMKFIILPSVAEGMPICVIEAMKAAVVPLVNDLQGGIQELVLNNETGYRVGQNIPEAFAERIIELLANDELYEAISKRCEQMANNMFDSIHNTVNIETSILNAARSIKKNRSKKVYGSRLDQPWLPNAFVNWIRKIK